MQVLNEALPDIDGKCISITTKTSIDSHTIEIDKPRFENQLGRIFITGTSPKGSTESGWIEGRDVAVAWDQVTEYYIFDDAKSFTKAAESARDFYKNKL